jgi:hypothetical protein
MGLVEARLELVEGAKSITGIKSAPEKIPEGSNPFPFAAAHVSTGGYVIAPAGVKTGLHNIMVELHVGRVNLAYDYDLLEPLIDELSTKWLQMLMNKNNPNGFQQIRAIERIEYSLEPAEWAGEETLACIFICVGCKVQTNL